jgi:hypothetical protein
MMIVIIRGGCEERESEGEEKKCFSFDGLKKINDRKYI